jgi:hypothetical protein
MMKWLAVVLFVMLALPIAVMSQKPVDKPAPSYKVEPTPQLTEIETLKIENLQLTFKEKAAEMQAIRNQYQEIANTIELEHPGYMINPDGNDRPSLLKKPEQPKAPDTK